MSEKRELELWFEGWLEAMFYRKPGEKVQAVEAAVRQAEKAAFGAVNAVLQAFGLEYKAEEFEAVCRQHSPAVTEFFGDERIAEPLKSSAANIMAMLGHRGL